jgi:hypothetical protein
MATITATNKKIGFAKSDKPKAINCFDTIPKQVSRAEFYRVFELSLILYRSLIFCTQLIHMLNNLGRNALNVLQIVD